MMTLDDYDKKLLRLMQDDSDRTVQDYADAIGLSATPTARRMKRLSDAGVIRKQVSLLDPDALGLKTTLFVFIRTSRHDGDWLDAFSKGVKRMPEVVEFYRMGGDVDYLLKIMLPEISDYDAVYKRLIAIAPLSDVSASFAMEALKNTTELPL
ncbi:Lrp/AsnC family transcriptional regulator [Oceanicaulis alexandrii]|uniref:Lrp/AsnC family transcriptional regulator n=1 Tax=Oceanicaulis TaxID=153232 RepID=UPI0035D0949D